MSAASTGLSRHEARRLRSCRVEVHTVAGDRHRGVVLSASDASLWLCVEGGDVFVALGDVAQLHRLPDTG